MYNVVEIIKHPKTDNLQVEIKTDGICFFFDEDGDWYSETWCKNPLETCKEDAIKVLDEKYNGTYYQETYGEYSEKITFSAK